MKSRLLQKYKDEVIDQLIKEFNYKNRLMTPKLIKVVINVGLGEALADKAALDSAAQQLASISGQKPVITRARRAISSFKLRAGDQIGMMVTLRGEKMYIFLDKLFNIILPRLRDFRGVSPSSFDGRGNYSLGFAEQVVFPEIDYKTLDKLRGLEISIVTNAKNNQEAKRLLELLGMPFAPEKSGVQGNRKEKLSS